MAFSLFCWLLTEAKIGQRGMAQGRITKRAVDALGPTGKDPVFLWDDSRAGFGAFPTGKKVYFAQYRQNGRSRRVAIGAHGRLTPDEARSRAKAILGAVEKPARTRSRNAGPHAPCALLFYAMVPSAPRSV
jgi:hypothetical protein